MKHQSFPDFLHNFTSYLSLSDMVEAGLMEASFTHQEEREGAHLHNQHQQLKLCLPLVRIRGPNTQNPLSIFGFCLSKYIRGLYSRARISNSCCLGRLSYDVMVVNNSAFCDSVEEGITAMEGLIEKSEGLDEVVGKVETFGELIEFEEKGRESCSSSDFLTSETTGHEEQSHSSSEESSSSPSLGWPVQKSEAPDCTSENGTETHLDDRKLQKQGSTISETELMKERFAKLLLGEDMSGCGNGVSTALAISNAITNLCATLFGQLWRLEPLPREKKLMWRREMEWLLCVSDHIVELIPSWQTFPDGSKLEVMSCRPRSDLYVNFPALRKLDNMLLEILDGFDDTEFWYVDQGILAPDADGSISFRRAFQRQEEKWWLPVPRVPPGGLHETTRKQLQHKRDCTNQILKAAMAINSITLADIEVPESYLEALPKNGRASLGDVIYRYISSDQFSAECLLDCLDLSSEHQAIEIANRVESSIYLWRQKTNSKPKNNNTRNGSKSSWEMVKEMMVVDADKRELLAERAESLLICLKQRFPGLPQTSLDMSKIQYNKDVGKSILESYSRVLESLAFNIVARIDDLLYVDDLTRHSDQFPSRHSDQFPSRHSDQFPSISKVSVISHKATPIPYSSVPISSTPYKTAYATPNYSPAQRASPFMTNAKISPQRGLGVKKVLTDYLSIDTKGKNYSNSTESPGSVSDTMQATLTSQMRRGSFESSSASSSPVTQDSDTQERIHI